MLCSWKLFPLGKGDIFDFQWISDTTSSKFRIKYFMCGCIFIAFWDFTHVDSKQVLIQCLDCHGRDIV